MNNTNQDKWAFTTRTSLPSVITIPASHITLLDSFFRIVDACPSKPEVSQEFTHLFTNDGIWKTPSATFSGIDQVAESGHRWGRFGMVKTMRHWVDRVYVNDAEGEQLMLLGTIRMEMDDEAETVVEKAFGAWVEIEGNRGDRNDGSNMGSGSGGPRLKLFQGWSSQQ